MRVRWTTDAADDLEPICDYVARDRPEAARRLALDVLHAIDGLRAFPNRGRAGRVQGTRELVLARPFLAVYEVADEEVQILRILHGARQWPAS
jgi:addiction module RelE/StbE family toxin